MIIITPSGHGSAAPTVSGGTDRVTAPVRWGDVTLGWAPVL